MMNSSLTMTTTTQNIWNPKDLYKPLAHSSSTINRRRPTVPLRALDYRNGVGDPKCMYEVTGGGGVFDTGPSMSMRDVCSPILLNDPSTRMGDYLNCMADYMQRGTNACGYSYQKDLRPENYDGAQHPNFVREVVNAPQYFYPSVEAYNAAYKHYSDLEADGYGNWTKTQMSPTYTYHYGW